MSASSQSRLLGCFTVTAAVGATFLWVALFGLSPIRALVSAVCVSSLSQVCGDLFGPGTRVVSGADGAIRVPDAFSMPSVVGLTGCVAARSDRRVADAIETVRTERCRAARERAAFEVFAKAVDKLSPQQPQPRVPPHENSLLVRPPTPDRQIAEIYKQYRETVMSVPHYEEDYGDTRAESMRVEFGEELVSALAQSETLIPGIKHAVVENALAAAESRQSFVETLDRELTTLQAASETFTATGDVVAACDATPWRQRSFEALVAAYERVDEHEDECERLLTDRQRTRSTAWRGYKLDELHEYLYASTYPILSDGITLLFATEKTKRVLVRELVRRV